MSGLCVLGAVLAASISLLVAPAFAGEPLPPHAVAVDQYGTWTCERGYLMRAHAGGYECIPEEEAAHEPQFEVSDLPSAGDGARSVGGEDLGRGYGSAPAGAQAPIVIQSNQPWTVMLDEQGIPTTVIVGGTDSPHGGSGRSRGDHHHRDRRPRPDYRPIRPGAVPR